MRVVMLEAPEELLAERRKKGLDRWDEVWEGILHMVPPPSGWHQRFVMKLATGLLPVFQAKGLEAAQDVGAYRPGHGERDYRQPDLVIARPDQFTRRGIEGPCEVAVEVLSPDDESFEKLPFYAALGIREVWIVDPDTREIRIHALSGKQLLPLSADPSGSVRSSVLGVSFATIEGPKLRVSWQGGETLI